MTNVAGTPVMEERRAGLERELEFPQSAGQELWEPGMERAPKPKRYWLAALLVLALGAAGFAAWRLTAKPAAPAFTPVTVHRGDLEKTISATGKVQAVKTVEVGTQVSGTVAELHADFNDHVKAGQIVARLDDSQFQAQYTQANANLRSAIAQLAGARAAVANADAAVEASQANVNRADSVLADAQRTYDRTDMLFKNAVAPQQQLDSAKAALDQAVAQKAQAIAQLNQAKAQALNARTQITQSEAQVEQTRAAADVVKVNLDRTVIRSPIDGVVVARNVDVGQTVAASLQAPTLFLIANDLTKMQVLADIDEADVGQLQPGNPVHFTVDAFPADTFRGRIAEIRLAPQNVQNVVTYTAVIDVDNPELKLKPGMTANVTVTVADRQDVLKVPNAALRFRPATTPEAPALQDPAAARLAGPRTRPNRAPAANRAVIWKVEGGQLQPARVTLGLTDGVFTEVMSGDLQDGDQVATPAQQAQTAAEPVRSMFPMGGRGGRR